MGIGHCASVHLGPADFSWKVQVDRRLTWCPLFADIICIKLVLFSKTKLGRATLDIAIFDPVRADKKYHPFLALSRDILLLFFLHKNLELLQAASITVLSSALALARAEPDLAHTHAIIHEIIAPNQWSCEIYAEEEAVETPIPPPETLPPDGSRLSVQDRFSISALAWVLGWWSWFGCWVGRTGWSVGNSCSRSWPSAGHLWMNCKFFFAKLHLYTKGYVTDLLFQGDTGKDLW